MTDIGHGEYDNKPGTVWDEKLEQYVCKTKAGIEYTRPKGQVPGCFWPNCSCNNQFNSREKVKRREHQT